MRLMSQDAMHYRPLGNCPDRPHSPARGEVWGRSPDLRPSPSAQLRLNSKSSPGLPL
jgi:hypothetical protein